MPDPKAIRPPVGKTLQRLSLTILRLIGWRIEGQLPESPKFVLILYPHTSNWDLVIGILAAAALGLLTEYEYGFMVKDSVIKAPILGRFIRWLGGIPIDRSSKTNAVDQMAEVFAQRERMMLGITPEGTRKHTDFWKSGFYHIARRAHVPVLLSYLDYGRRAAGLGPAVSLTGDVEADLDVMRRFYAPVVACHPKDAGAIRFRPEV